mgnify:CR=1 FL=1
MKNTKVRTSVARLDAWTRGVICGMHLGQMKRQDMLAHVTKKDGSPWQLHYLDDGIANAAADPADSSDPAPDVSLAASLIAAYSHTPHTVSHHSSTSLPPPSPTSSS